MSYLENLVQVFEIDKPVYGLCPSVMPSVPQDGFAFAVRKAHDLAGLRRAIIAKLDTGIAEHRVSCNIIGGILDPAVHALVARADYNASERFALCQARLDPIVYLGDGSLCLLSATFLWRTLPVTHLQALGILGLLRDNARLRRPAPVVLAPNARQAADRGLGRAIGQHGRPAIGLIETTARR